MLRPVLILCVGFAAVATAVGDEKDRPKHPQLQAALYELGEAKAELEASKLDYGGKKAEASKAIGEAQTSLKLILAVKGDVKPPVRDKERYKGFADRPHLRAALQDLRAARRELQDSKTDFQGNRKEALKKIDAAIEQLERVLKVER